ncbi:MAG: choice-of-anchor D domain-containing protein [Acidobacteriaceae bacterium]
MNPGRGRAPIREERKRSSDSHAPRYAGPLRGTARIWRRAQRVSLYLGMFAILLGLAGAGAALGFQKDAGQEIHQRHTDQAAAAGGGAQASPSSRQAQRAIRFVQRRGIARRAGQPTPAAILKLGRAQHAAMVRARAADTGTSPATSAWQPVGPLQVNTSAWNLVTGRVTTLAADPSDTAGNTLYAGTNGGGIWKSTNAAGNAPTFTPLTDDLNVFSTAALTSLSIGAVSVQPGGTGVVLGGTGDPSDATDSWYGVGLLRSADGGNTWSLIDETPANGGVNYNFTGNAFAQFAWSTTAPNLVVAAVSQSRYNALLGVSNGQSVLGLYYSTDAGATWQLATIEDGTNHVVQSPLGNINTGNAATSVVWNPVRARFYAAIRYHGYYESLDGITFTRLANQPGVNLTPAMCPTNSYSVGSPACPLFRGVLAAQPVTGDLFALTVDQNNLDQGLWQDACRLAGGACASNTVLFGTEISDAALDASNGTIADGMYNLALAAVPAQQDTLLFAGTTDLWRCSLANSCAWRNTTNTQTCAAAQVAPSQHAIEATFGASGLMYFGNDGGLWRTSDAVSQPAPACSTSDASHFQNLNGGLGSLAEVESVAEDPNTPTTWLAALGDLGTAAPAASQGAWNQVLNGEGNVVAIDPVNPQNWYATSEFGVGINACTAGTACDVEAFGNVAVGASQVDDDVQLIPAPWILDPQDTSNVILGTCRVWRGAASGSGWSDNNLLSGMLDGESGSFCNGNAEIRSLAAGVVTGADAGAEQIYAGMAGFLEGGGLAAGHVFTAAVNNASEASTTVWIDAGKSPVTNDANSGSSFDPGGFGISSLYVDPHDTTGQTVYATVQGYLAVPNFEPLLYVSTNGGAQWLDVTSNLPRVPANSVLVDPNDASTVYVALDTGVYYTQNIGSCASGNSVCWNVYGTGIPNAPVISLMAYNEGTTEQLRAATYGRGMWQIDLLTAGIAQTTASASPAAVTFAGQLIGTSSDTQTVTVKDTGPLNLNISTVSITGEFTESDNCAGQSIAPHGDCQIQVTFSPADAGTLNGSMIIMANLDGGQLTIPLSGTGLSPPNLALIPGSLTFPVTTVGSTSAAQSITVSNSGDLPVALTAETATGDFSITNNTCGASLAGQGSCTVGVVFSPTASGTRTGTLSVMSALPTQAAQLSGTAQTVASDVVSPLSLAFADQQLGTTSATQVVSITNNGDQTLTGIAVSITANFTLTNNCGTTLAGHSSCSMLVAFAPSTAGVAQGSLAITDAIHTQTVAMSGNGLLPPQLSVAPLSMGYGGVTINTNSAVQTVSLTNVGGYALASLTAAVTPGFSIASNNCPSTLGLSSSCQIGVIFAPTAAGSLSGSVTVSASNLPAATVVGLTGTGLTPGNIVITPVSVSFPATLIGSTAAAQTVTVANTGGSPVALSSESVSGDFAINSNTCGTSLAAQASCQMAIVFTPSASGARAGTLSVADSLGTQTATLSGTGQSAATDTLSPLSVAFGNQQVGTTSATQTVTLTNTGDQTLTNIAVSGTGSFTLIDNCAATLVGHTTCSMLVAFAPASTGAVSGALTVSDEFRTQTVALGGTGLAPPAIATSASSVDFGSVTVNATSTVNTVTVTNRGGYPIIDLSALATPGFGIASNDCPASLAVGSSCQIGIEFSPAATGSLSGSLTLSAANLPTAMVVGLTGTGLGPGNIVLTPVSISFPATLIGSTAAAQSVTVANSGGSPVALSSESVTGDFAISSNSCGASLAAQASCQMAIVFTPSASGTRSGSLSVVDSLGTQTAPLSGTGQSAATDSLSATSLAFGNQQVGTTSATQAIILSNSGDQILTSIAVSSTGSFTLTNTCGATLAGHTTCSMLVAFAPLTAGAAQGTLAVSDEFRSQPVALTGTGLAPPAISIAPSSVDFGSVTVNATSAVSTVTVTNTGGYPISNLAAFVTTGFAITANNCPASLALGASCQIAIDFAPSAASTVTGTLTLSGSNLSASSTVALSGSGVTPGNIILTPTSLAFAATAVGTTAVGQSVDVANTGGTAVTLTTESASGDFTITANPCSAQLPAQTSCEVVIVFKPSTAGMRTGTLTVVDGLGTQTASLSGTGQTEATDTLAPSSLVFPAQQVGTSSASQNVTLTNSGDEPLTQIAVSGSGDFAIANACGGSLQGHESCAIQVIYAPTMTGAETGVLTVVDELRTQSVSLSGTGVAPPGISATPTTIDFGGLAVGSTSGPQSVTVTNSGGYPINSLAPVATTGFAIASDNCPPTLDVGTACQVGLTFSPTTAGSVAGTLTVSATNLPHAMVVALAGAGEDFTIVVNGSSSSVVTSGDTATFSLQLAGLSGSSGTVALVCSGMPANATCSLNPSSLTLTTAGSSSSTLSLTTGVSTSSSELRPPGWKSALPLLACFLPLTWIGLRRRRLAGLMMVLLSICLLIPAGCGVGASGGGGGGGGGSGGQQHSTPPGTYVITVTATMSNIVHSTAVSLTVQ